MFPEHFIERRVLETTFFKIPNVFPKLAVSGVSKEYLHKLIGFDDNIGQFNDNTNSVDSSRYFIIKDTEDFNYLCNKYNGDIHWIHGLKKDSFGFFGMAH
ncbi:hypothetical protein C0J52_26369 [Blattella germanica]|nr:hypothetical protein C0J52_26369 [Blattella germanica]